MLELIYQYNFRVLLNWQSYLNFGMRNTLVVLLTSLMNYLLSSLSAVIDHLDRAVELHMIANLVFGSDLYHLLCLSLSLNDLTLFLRVLLGFEDLFSIAHLLLYLAILSVHNLFLEFLLSGFLSFLHELAHLLFLFFFATTSSFFLSDGIELCVDH